MVRFCLQFFCSVFTTVLRCLGPQADPAVNPSLSPNFLVDALGKMVTGAGNILKHHWEEALLDALNQVQNLFVLLKELKRYMYIYTCIYI